MGQMLQLWKEDPLFPMMMIGINFNSNAEDESPRAAAEEKEAAE